MKVTIGAFTEPTCVPALNILYPPTATLSVEAVHVTVAVVGDEEIVVIPCGTDGGVVSTCVVTSAAVDAADTFGVGVAVSYASTVYEYCVPGVKPVSLYVTAGAIAEPI